MTHFTFKSTRAIRQLGRITAALTDSPMSRAQLCERLHLSTPMICDYLGHLMESPRKVHIKAFAPNSGGRQTPVYALGSGKDAIEPPRKNKTAWYRKLQADTERHAFHLARERARDCANKATKTPQHWASALLGAAVREVRH